MRYKNYVWIWSGYMNNDKPLSDKDVDEFLQGDSNVSNMYKKGNELKTPKHLDISIKSMARDAEHAQAALQNTNKTRWLIPTSIAASIMIAFTLYNTDTNVNDDISSSPIVSNNLNEKASDNIISNQTNDVEVIVQTKKITEKIPSSINSEVNTTGVKETDIKVSDVKVSGSTDKKEITVSQSTQQKDPAEFELPAELSELLRNTSTKVNDDLPPPKILKSWTHQQWQDQVKTLQKSGNTKLADKFIKEYKKYFPEKSLF